MDELHCILKKMMFVVPWWLLLYLVVAVSIITNEKTIVHAQSPNDIKAWVSQLKQHRKRKSNVLNDRRNNLRGAIIPPNVDTKKLVEELSSLPARYSLPNLEKPGSSLYLMFPSQTNLTQNAPEPEPRPDLDSEFQTSSSKRTPTGRKAVVTFLCGGSDANNFRYARFLHAFTYTLRKSGYTGEILVLYTLQFPLPKVAKTLKQFDVSTQKVDQISIPQKGHRYEHMLTKLHIWNLLQYDQIMYYDVDFVFQQNPIPAFEECGGKTPLCAVHDQGIKDFKTSVPASEYFNAGFLVVIPSRFTYHVLVERKMLANDYQFVEQDLLNQVFRGKWKALDSKYNLMHSYRQKVIDSNIVAIHEKLPELRRVFTDKRYVWNDNFRRN